MKSFAVVATILGAAGVALAQGVTSAISPSASAPAGCSASYDGQFEVTVAKVEGNTKRGVSPVAKRTDCSGDGILVVTLADGILTDAQNRTGYIASNYQFQFDEPPQAGAIYTSGFSSCTNGSLALGGSAVWYECRSGDFYNLYDRDWAEQCSAVEIIIMACGGGNSDESTDGQVVGTQVVTTTIVSALSDGQAQVKTTTTGVAVCQISQIADGQVQVATTPCASITTSAASSAISTLAPVSQYSDGQIQVTPAESVPTVTSVAESTGAAGTTAASGGEGSSVSLPTETQVSGSGSATASGGSTDATSQSASSGSSSTSSGGSAATSAPASSAAADKTTMGAFGAFVVGLMGVVALL